MSFFKKTEGGLKLFIKVQPGASKNAVEDIVTDAAGQAYLKVRVTAAPEKGKANKAVCKLLAKTWNVSPSSLTIAARETSRLKLFHLHGNPEALTAQLQHWLSHYSAR